MTVDSTESFTQRVKAAFARKRQAGSAAQDVRSRAFETQIEALAA